MILKNNFITFNLKKNFSAILFFSLIISLILFSENNIVACKLGLNLWANNIVPSLFPFFIATELLLCTNIINICGKLFKKIMIPLFNVPGESFIALLLGILSGYPVGAKIVCELKEKNICNQEECERLLAFTNNSGPLFIVGTIGTTFLQDTNIGITLLIIHILSSILIGIMFSFWKKQKSSYSNIKYEIKTQSISITNLGEILSNAISKSISTIFIIGGFVVIFSVFISIIYQTKILRIFDLFPFSSILKSIFIGLIELTNGIYEITKSRY